MGAKDYRRETTPTPGIYRLVRISDGEVVSHQVYYRDSARKQRVKTFSGPKTISAAREWKAKEVGSKKPYERHDPSLSKVTLGQIYDEHVTKKNKEPFSRKTMEVRNQVRQMPGLQELFATRLDRIDTVTVDEAIKRATQSPGMAREARKWLRAAFAYAEKTRRVHLPFGNPVDVPPMRKPRAKSIATRQEIARLIEEMPDRYRMFVELLARTGMRTYNEGAALRVKNFDPLKREICVDEASKTGERCFPIPQDLSDKLWAHVEKYSDQMDPDALIFTTEAGEPIQGHNAHNWRRRVFGPASKRAGIHYPRWTPYSLRHFACSNALSLGIDLGTVAAMSGHSVQMLASTYAHAMRDAQERAAEVLGAAWNVPA